ncbi:family 16 glycosylhydrolase [Paracoccus sp. JM45]|uniref:family 16 glycosylhydrolase n=1 Tax=Paracoccus sp. JM45 TaxID=2283626 RepID=UPI0016046192|nr:family 16 glycosylhydrolase [Paracoccus sp. JM45]
MRQSIAIAIGLVMMAQPSLAHVTDLHPETAGFYDDFSEGLDKDRWYVSDGWTNGDWQDCEWSGRAVKAQSGMLSLFHTPAPLDEKRPPLCGEVQTKAFFQYGTFEARIRTPKQSGLNASIFTYTGPVHGTPHDEIDIEILTRDPDVMTMNTYVAGAPLNGGKVPANPSFDDAFHTVGFRWDPEGITWYMDGQEVHRTEPDATLPSHPQKLFMSFWSTATLTDWMGRQTAQDGPLEYQIDWIAYTPLDASCLFEGSVTCEPN